MAMRSEARSRAQASALQLPRARRARSMGEGPSAWRRGRRGSMRGERRLSAVQCARLSFDHRASGCHDAAASHRLLIGAAPAACPADGL